MSRAILTGAAGGIMGSITAGIGVIWSIMDTLLKFATIPLQSYYQTMFGAFLFADFDIQLFETFIHELWPVVINYFLVINPSAASFSWFSIMLVIPITISVIVTSVGFYGMYRMIGGTTGALSLVFSIIGSIVLGLALFFGSAPTIYPIWSLNLFILVYQPNYYIIETGLITLAAPLILFGYASIILRDVTAHPSASKAAGILSITGAGLLTLYIVLPIIGFGLILTAFILWAIIFYSSKKI